MNDRNVKLYLKDIMDAMELIEAFVKNMNFDEFRNNEILSSAVL
jgi:uncharacterized protein with HEPN domain